MSRPRPLYDPGTLYDNPDDQVLLVQGEQEADAASKILPEMPCTCWSEGWGDVSKVDVKWFIGKTVYIWPEKTRRGASLALSLARHLRWVDIVFILWLPEAFPHGWTLRDEMPKKIDDPWDLIFDENLTPERYAEFARLKYPGLR